MAVLIKEPNKKDINLDDWSIFLKRTTFQGGGFINILLDGLDTEKTPRIKAGSRLEVNGGFYEVNSGLYGGFYIVKSDEEISDPEKVANEQWIFVYAVPKEAGLTFEYSNIMPIFSVEKCGYYNGGSRAIAKMYKRADGYWSKVILNDYDSLYKDNTTKLPSTITNVNDIVRNVISYGIVETIDVNAGVYFAKLKGGKGGKGGRSRINSIAGLATESKGGEGALGEEKGVAFAVSRKKTLNVRRGGDGENGVSSNEVVDTGGGGGGASGEASVVFTDEIEIIAEGGSGGGGAGGAGGTQGTGRYGGGGGGGGGGYGIGQDGDNGQDADRGVGGKGGNNFIGGDGGSGGHNGGTSGEKGITSRFSPAIRSGGASGGGRTANSVTGDKFSAPKAGGTHAVSSASSYAKIYRLWSSIER
jgi:hypothetical protein